MEFFVSTEPNITTSNIGEDVDENGDTYSLYNVVSGYNKDITLKYNKNIYISRGTVFSLAHYTWKSQIVGSEYAINLHTQTDIYPTNGEILINITNAVTVVYVEENESYYIAKTTATVDFMQESIENPANFTKLTDPIFYRHEYNYPDGFNNTLYWKYVSVSNKHRAFDRAIGSQSEREDEITYSLTQTGVSGIIFINAVADNISILITDNITGDTHPIQTASMIDTSHLDNYEKVCTLSPIEQTSRFFRFASTHSVTIDITIEKIGSRAKIGAIKLGLLEDLGMTLDGVDVKNKSYNESGVRANGEYVWNPTDVPENKVSLIDYGIIYDTYAFDSIDKKMKEITDKDVVILGDERDEHAFKTLQTYCVVTSASAQLSSNSEMSHGSISIETFK